LPTGEASRGAAGPLADFLRALRAVYLPISPAEAIDAHRAAAEVGWASRDLLKDALCVTLAKTAEETVRFDHCFDTFFARDAGPAPGGLPEPGAGAAQSLDQLLLADDAGGVAAAMEAAASQVGVSGIRLGAQRNLLTRRMLDAMGLRELEALINTLRAAGGARDQALAERLGERRAALFAQAAAFVDRQARLYASESGRRLREQILKEQSLTAIAPEDFRAMERLVRKMAKRLASRYARRRHRARRGNLDVRKTVRRSMVTGGIPFDVVWKSRKVEKPRIMVICDVSRSVAAAAQFLLLFLYSLNEVVDRLDAFAFSDRLVAVDDLLNDETVDDAITLILARIGFRATDYGRALEDFRAATADSLTRRTTVIVLGDGRSNFADPRLDLMGEIAQRSRAVIWLNPEPESYWGQGDSRMDAYRRFCRVAKTCNTLKDLEAIIETVLRTYLPR
jgi:uncharacterized protein with von Willebrand factor type A (vWA) domain